MLRTPEPIKLALPFAQALRLFSKTAPRARLPVPAVAFLLWPAQLALSPPAAHRASRRPGAVQTLAWSGFGPSEGLAGPPTPAPHPVRTRRAGTVVHGSERPARRGRREGREGKTRDGRALTILEVAGAIARSVPAALAGPLVGVVVVVIGVIVRILVGVVGVVSYHDIFPPRSEVAERRQSASPGAASVAVGPGAAGGAGGSAGSRRSRGGASGRGGGSPLAPLPSGATLRGSLVAGLKPVPCAGAPPAAGGGLGLRGGGLGLRSGGRGSSGGGSPRQRAVVPQQQDGAARRLRRLPAPGRLVLGPEAEQAVHLPVVLPLDPLPPGGGGRRGVAGRRLLGTGGPQAAPVDACVEMG